MSWRRRVLTALKKTGIQVERSQPDLATFLKSRKVETVLDIGANIGQYGEHLRSVGYHGDIISFEPTSAAFEQLHKRAKKDRLWKVHKCGLGRLDQTAVINIAQSTVFNSIKATSEAASKFDLASRYVSQETIEIKPLSVFLNDISSSSIFIKIDTQGFEQEVLGGFDLLDTRIAGIQLELPMMHLYKDQWAISTAIDFMYSMGFAIRQLAPVNYHPTDRNALVEIDCIFGPKLSYE